MNLSNNKTTVLILNHYTVRSDLSEHMEHRILRFLRNKVKRIIIIAHPFPESKSPYSYCSVYEGNQKIKELRVFCLRGPSIFQYLYHIPILYYFLFKTQFIFDLCIAMDNLSFISIYPLRMMGIIKRLIYYSLDFVPNRFPNFILNSIYHFIDKLACKYSDNNWFVVEEQIKYRESFGITPTNSAPVTLVPTGLDNNIIKKMPLGKIDFYNVVYTGGFREETGVELILTAMPLLIDKFPQIKLTIVGTGPLENKLKKIIKDLKIEKWVNFLGYIEDFDELAKIITTKSIGLAPYAPIPGSYSYYSDTSKIKLYFSCGLPVITTAVASLSSLISKTKSGIVIDYSEKSLTDAISYLLDDKKNYSHYKDAAVKISVNFDVNHILDNAFKNIS